jgi:hypothetical protein
MNGANGEKNQFKVKVEENQSLLNLSLNLSLLFLIAERISWR